MKVCRNLTFGLFVFLTLSIGVISANSITKSVYGQSNYLTQNGGGIGNQFRDQNQASDEDNQVVSGDSSILSGNNLQCQSQDNSKVSEIGCDSGDGGLVRDRPDLILDHGLNLEIRTNEERPQYRILTEWIGPQGELIDKTSESMTTSPYFISKDYKGYPYAYTLRLTIDTLQKDRPVFTTVIPNPSTIPINCVQFTWDSGIVRCDANLLSRANQFIFSIISLTVPPAVP